MKFFLFLISFQFSFQTLILPLTKTKSNTFSIPLCIGKPYQCTDFILSQLESDIKLYITKDIVMKDSTTKSLIYTEGNITLYTDYLYFNDNIQLKNVYITTIATSKGNLINDSANSIQVSNPHQNSKKIIIITNSTQNKDNQQTSKLTYEEGPYSIQCEVGKPPNQMNKKVIDNTVKILQETIKKKGRNGASELSSHHSDIKHSSVQPSDKPAISQSSSSEDNDVIENSISHNIPNHIVMQLL